MQTQVLTFKMKLRKRKCLPLTFARWCKTMLKKWVLKKVKPSTYIIYFQIFMKKTFKIIGIVLGVLIVLLIAAPFLFKGSLEKMLNKAINENLNATVSWESLDLSLLRSFPDASLKVKGFSVINKSPFEGDTLASGKSLSMDMGIMQLFKSKDLKIDGFTIDGALLNIKVDSLGNTNYDITLEDESDSKSTSDDEGFTFELQQYEIKNSRIHYSDETLNTFIVLDEVQHKGKGDLSEDISTLKTYTETVASFKMDDTQYLTNHKIALDATFEIDLNNMKFSFLDNEGKINELPLVFNGYVQMNEDNNEVDLTFKTPSSDFKNFLAIIPEEYVKQISDVKTTGDFVVDGVIKGIVDDVHIPTMDIKITSNNASFKYPDLPKTVDNITMDVQLMNETGLLKDTYLNIPKVTFRIDNEPFTMSGDVKNFTENALVNLNMKGTLNLANIEQVFPMEMEQDLKGIFIADMTANFDMNSVEKEQYQNIKINGTASLTDFSTDAGFKNEFKISKASISGQPGIINLKELNASTGKTDIRASGNIQNLLSFLMGKQNLKGHFSVASNTFDVNDFMVSDSDSEGKDQKKELSKDPSTEVVKIPDFLDATLDFTAQKVLYDDIQLTNASGSATIKDETLTLRNFTSDIFGGNIAFAGNVSTKGETPTFAMNLDLSKIDIDKSFAGLEMFQYIAPIAKAMQGSLNTNFKLNGNLTKDLSLDLSTLGGSAVAEIISAEVNPQLAPALTKLSDAVSFIDMDKLSLHNVTTNFAFDNGNIEVKPFHFDVKGIDVDVAGTHGLDKSMNYNLNMEIPAKYLGSEVTKLLKDLRPEEAEQMSVQLPVGITGSFTQPKINVNAESAIRELTNEIVAKQKESLIDKGKGLLDDLINKGKDKKGETEAGETSADSTAVESPQETKTDKQQETRDKVKDVFDGIFGGKKKKEGN